MLRTTRETDTGIYGFFGKYRPLSNFDITPFTHDGLVYKSAEHAFHCAKTLDKDWFTLIFNAATPSEAKKLGRQCPLRSDWNDVRFDIMRSITFSKFVNSPALRKLLLSTEDKYLEETNDWGDSFWGFDLQKGGKNYLGHILMSVRNELRILK